MFQMFQSKVEEYSNNLIDYETRKGDYFIFEFLDEEVCNFCNDSIAVTTLIDQYSNGKSTCMRELLVPLVNFAVIMPIYAKFTNEIIIILTNLKNHLDSTLNAERLINNSLEKVKSLYLNYKTEFNNQLNDLVKRITDNPIKEFEKLSEYSYNVINECQSVEDRLNSIR